MNIDTVKTPTGAKMQSVFFSCRLSASLIYAALFCFSLCRICLLARPFRLFPLTVFTQFSHSTSLACFRFSRATGIRYWQSSSTSHALFSTSTRSVSKQTNVVRCTIESRRYSFDVSLGQEERNQAWWRICTQGMEWNGLFYSVFFSGFFALKPYCISP